ncbi:hypothetical protein E2542_SST29364 [Spatholobus suberectus]|nr:hypothetical protein E2542_SST29364 [Spatholobus suberectus]
MTEANGVALPSSAVVMGDSSCNQTISPPLSSPVGINSVSANWNHNFAVIVTPLLLRLLFILTLFLGPTVPSFNLLELLELDAINYDTGNNNTLFSNGTKNNHISADHQVHMEAYVLLRRSTPALELMWRLLLTLILEKSHSSQVFSMEARRVAEKAYDVAKVDKRVNRAVTATNRAANAARVITVKAVQNQMDHMMLTARARQFPLCEAISCNFCYSRDA